MTQSEKLLQISRLISYNEKREYQATHTQIRLLTLNNFSIHLFLLEEENHDLSL